jgi:hypothetical protein
MDNVGGSFFFVKLPFLSEIYDFVDDNKIVADNKFMPIALEEA